MATLNFSRFTDSVYGESYRLTNGIIDLTIPLSFGPRVMRCGFVGEPNQFAELPRTPDADQWQITGGHRFWCAPEDPFVTYEPDNDPVTVEPDGDAVTITQPTGARSGVQKRLTLRLSPDAAHVQVVHRLVNRATIAQVFAPWALSVMAAGGIAILPLPPRARHSESLLPANALVMWRYTDLSDPRWVYGARHLLLRQDAASSPETPQKIGSSHVEWLAYWRAGTLFVKRSRLLNDDFPYPDMGCSAEIFTNHAMLELETLGRLRVIEPGAEHPDGAHVEDWYLYRDVPEVRMPEDVERIVLPLLNG